MSTVSGGAAPAGVFVGLYRQQADIMRHQPQALLLTGAPGVGKTTIMQEVLRALSGRKIRGFLTGEIRRAGQRVGFELTTIGGRRTVLAHVDVDSRHRVGRYGVDVAALDAAAEEALALDDATEVYVVDEIGKMECSSARFRAAIRRLLVSAQPLVATVALRGTGFIAEVKDRKDVEIWEATRTNRDQMPERIVGWLDRVSRPQEVDRR
jgi:nucleoside-triphosphatase